MKIALVKPKKNSSLLQLPNTAKSKKGTAKRTKKTNKEKGVIWLSIDELIQKLAKEPKKYLPLALKVLMTYSNHKELNEATTIKYNDFVVSLNGASVIPEMN